MKKSAIFSLVFLSLFLISCSDHNAYQGCNIGAFIDDMPDRSDIDEFKDSFDKDPKIVMVFIDWENFIDERVLKDIIGSGSDLFITWEMWYALDKTAIDYKALLNGEYDPYIIDFGERLKNIEKDIYIRIGHEVNGDWYPWSGKYLTPEDYIEIFKHIRRLLDKAGAFDLKWVYSINWENIPKENNYIFYYPGDDYVDYIGIDGYNWGDTQPWSKWMSFHEIFNNIYEEITLFYDKPVIITEFGTTSSGGDKAKWILDSMKEIKKMDEIKAFILFNKDKECDWEFKPETIYGKALKKALSDNYFKD